MLSKGDKVFFDNPAKLHFSELRSNIISMFVSLVDVYQSYNAPMKPPMIVLEQKILILLSNMTSKEYVRKILLINFVVFFIITWL